MIRIADIEIANPRSRNQRIHRTITESIEQVGLKRPVTVRRIAQVDNGPSYTLVCGQGRIESCVMLGQTEIAAMVIDVSEETSHIMSIVENVARRSPHPAEVLESVRILKEANYSDSEIAQKLGCTTSWAGNVVTLLERGEKRLLAAAEKGQIPLHLAVGISRASSAEAQQLLLKAYESGEIKGKKVLAVRRLLDRRERSGKQLPLSSGKAGAKKQMSPEDLSRLYQEETAMHRRVQKKAEYTQKALSIVQQIFKELLSDREFRSLLKAENLASIPEPLSAFAGGASR